MSLSCSAGADFREKKIAEIYREYQKAAQEEQCPGFRRPACEDGRAFPRQSPDVLEYYQERFRYIMVDEYQDTNLCTV